MTYLHTYYYIHLPVSYQKRAKLRFYTTVNKIYVLLEGPSAHKISVTHKWWSYCYSDHKGCVAAMSALQMIRKKYEVCIKFLEIHQLVQQLLGYNGLKHITLILSTYISL
jgi:hypothetical protein